MARADNGQGMARQLGKFSLGLGTLQLTFPAVVNRLAGIRGPSRNAVMRAVGLQEIAVGGGILLRPSAAGLLWTRAAGDVTHLGMLAWAARNDENRPRRIVIAATAVAGLTLLDLVAATRLGRSDRGVLRARSTITVNRPATEVYRYWRDLENLPRFMHHLKSVRTIDGNRSHWVARAPADRQVEWDAEIVRETPGRLIAWRALAGADIPNAGAVRFAPAPGDAGTEVTVELGYQLPGGGLGATVATVFGEHPQQQVKDALRRFKQVVETGEVVRSDGSPEGSLTHRQFRQLAAQPTG